MSGMQRRKGQRGERELFALLSDRLGVVVRRNLAQPRGGGADGIEIPGWAVECKYQDREYVRSWWEQTLQQADTLQRRPILFYRRTGHRTWKCRVRLADLIGDRLGTWTDLDTAEIGLDAAAALIRETLT